MPDSFSILETKDAATLRNYLISEHPQIIALILCQIQSDNLRRDVLDQMPESYQAELIIRMAKMERVSAAALEKISRTLHHDLSELPEMIEIPDVLEKATSCINNKIVKRIEKVDPEVAERIKKAVREDED